MNTFEAKASMVSLLRDSEQQVLEKIDARTTQDTEILLQTRRLSTDCLIVGTGPAGVSFAAKLRQLTPGIVMHMVDDREYRGGQFADVGYNFKLNTPKQGPLGFPEELSDPNNLGDAAFVQVSDIATDEEDYFRRKTLATCLKVDGYVAASAIVGTEVVATERVNGSYKVTGVHEGQEVELNAKTVVFARGKGKSNLDSLGMEELPTENVFVSEGFNNHIDTLSPTELLTLITQRVAFIGAGDSANTSLEAIVNKLLTILSPDQVKQLTLDVYGARYTDPQTFQEDVRIPRYDALHPFIGTFIRPQKEKAVKLVAVGPNIGVETPQACKIYTTVALMTGYKNPPIESIVQLQAPVIDVRGDNGFGGEIIAQQIEGENIFIVGIDMRENFPGRPPVFARSIPRFTPRILATAKIIADILQSE